jgi:hypothetical protein
MNLTAVLIEGIKQQQKQINDLEKIIQKQQEQIDFLLSKFPVSNSYETN